MMTDTQVRDELLPLLRKRLGPYGFADAELRSGLDHDDDPVIFLTAKYADDAPDLPPRVCLDTMAAIGDLMTELSVDGAPKGEGGAKAASQ